MQEINLMK
jgi:hypothetical protein